MNANGSWSNQFINTFWKDRIINFWKMMQKHVHDDAYWAQNKWLPANADATLVDSKQCHIENWKYEWFLPTDTDNPEATSNAPLWEDLPDSYRQWWIWEKLPASGLLYYLRWINYDEIEQATKQRQLQRMIAEWNNMTTSQKCNFSILFYLRKMFTVGRWQ